MQHVKAAAFMWWCAERSARAHDVAGVSKETQSDIYATAIPRVLAVWAGKVLWEAASPGDRAVWKGRARQPDLVRADRHHEYVNYYDTISLDLEDGRVVWRTPYSVHRVLDGVVMFGNANIGNHQLTNLQVPGQMCGDVTLRVRQFYVDASRDVTTADRIVIALRVGAREVKWSGPVLEAMRGIPIDLILHPRQNFDVWVWPSRIGAPIELVAHLEGVQSSVK